MSPKQILKRAKELGCPAVGITDTGAGYGLVELFQAAKGTGIKPILGVEISVATDSRFEKRSGIDGREGHLILLAQNKKGWKNLLFLISQASLEGMYYKPRIDHDLLEELNEGLIVLSGCASGEIGVALKEDDYDRARDIAKWYKSIFGDRYYLELQDHGHPKSNTHWDVQEKINEGLVKLTDKLSDRLGEAYSKAFQSTSIAANEGKKKKYSRRLN